MKLNDSNTTQEWKLEISLIFPFPLILFSLFFSSQSINGEKKMREDHKKSLAFSLLKKSWKQIFMKISITSYNFSTTDKNNKLNQRVTKPLWMEVSLRCRRQKCMCWISAQKPADTMVTWKELVSSLSLRFACARLTSCKLVWTTWKKKNVKKWETRSWLDPSS